MKFRLSAAVLAVAVTTATPLAARLSAELVHIRLATGKVLKVERSKLSADDQVLIKAEDFGK